MTSTSQRQPDLSGEPLGAVVHRLSEQIPELVRSEIRLAQAELTEKGKRAGVGVGLFSVAGLLALYGLAALLTTVVVLLDLVLPLWAAVLIVTAVLFAAAGVAALTGKKQVGQATPPAPEKAIAGVKEDVATLKGGSHP
ncbi:phage holin family protein [Nocardioides sp.]|uniref:phage holin family protein n=1 Tax=Nocardioides sp. TaxID=35761 RepID=UPI001A1DA0A2|nr:phage holin family protein [Nocardioides sp.]MBJ7359025.1 phage holin family protein [Nocardioides sp.]